MDTMFFEIKNTPEHIRRTRVPDVKITSPKECPRLTLAPFSRPPQVVFENIHVGTSSERDLEVFNPSKQAQQICLGRALPPGLIIDVPGGWLEVEPETCYVLTMTWTPMQPMALRETIRFTNRDRGRYDINVVLKTVNAKEKAKQPKTFKISSGKMKKKSPKKKSPVSIYKKKSEVIYNTTKIMNTVNVQSIQNHRISKSSNKENIDAFDYSVSEYRPSKCPFDSSSNIDVQFDTSEIFPSTRKPENVLQNTYDKSYNMFTKPSEIFPSTRKPENLLQNTYDKSYNMFTKPGPSNVLQPSNKQYYDNSASDLFDNLAYTPSKRFKTFDTKIEKLEKGPKIDVSVNTESDFDDSIEIANKVKNETHSIICTSSEPPNKWLSVNHEFQMNHQYNETPIHNKKIPNTSSPKESLNSNFSINNEFSRISELSFVPQRCSTEKKVLAKNHNETQDLIDDQYAKLSTDTFTKNSPNNLYHVNQNTAEAKPPHCYLREQPKICKQSLFREHQEQKEIFPKNLINPHEYNVSHRDTKTAMTPRSTPRSPTPPLQSIPEESSYYSDTQVIERATHTINRTFDKVRSSSNKQTWSKKAIKAEPELWKMPAPPKKSLGPKSSNEKVSLCKTMSNTFEVEKSMVHNVTLKQMGDVYSQSLTVDPFLSSTYFYDEVVVRKFENEFKRWLNCILTPPADLDSNEEQKVDLGKAWIENRNKDVPAAPTKEQVSSAYHNSHRLESLRKSARGLLLSPEIEQVLQKLNLQIEKKLIAIRSDKNLHLDVGLQKAILELLLSYNPLWLRIGLEAIYNVVMPLKSNSDVEGLTTFIIQRMFKKPHLKNKHSKSNAPNMLTPAFAEATKKFTLKRFFMLAFFLDLAKQRKLIPHDPCLFRRNAVCKESREIIIRFTRELIAGIGDITKHLRPVGYVVSHKQSYLDEYEYAVHNIAADIRDGVRLTKVMEIILMKRGLLHQLRTPAISRLQKIHNVGVALNALKEADFAIVGDIAANDIADGHREKTLSLLWQLIHKFRAPLFMKAANVIQTWWRKKYEVIMVKRKEEERLRQKQVNAANLIQSWWRRIQYNRLVEQKMQRITAATIVLQKYCRMWLSRTRFRKLKESTLKIEEWFRSLKMMREAKETLNDLILQKKERITKSATVLQSYVRRWLCMTQYRKQVRKIVLIQSVIRCFITRKWYMRSKKSITYIQQMFKSKLLMKEEMKRLAEKKKSAIIIQKYYRMVKQRNFFQKLKCAIKTIEERYLALLKMRSEQKKYSQLKEKVILIQSWYRGKKCRVEYLRRKHMIIKLQRKFRAHQLMKKERANFLQIKKAVVILQKHVRSYLAMKQAKQVYTNQRHSVITIQRYFRSYLQSKKQKNSYIQLRNATIVLQKHYRSVIAMRRERLAFLKLRNATVVIQTRYRAQVSMKLCRNIYERLRNATLAIQRKYKAQLKMREDRSRFLILKSSCNTIQNAYRACVLGKKQRQEFLRKKEAAIKIQKWFRNSQRGKQTRQRFQEMKKACVTIQRVYRAYIMGRKQRQEYIKIKTATLSIQKFYRAYVEMKTVRDQYIQLKTAAVTVQRLYKSLLETKKQREQFLKIKSATLLIQTYYRCYRKTKITRQKYCKLKETVVCIQTRYRSKCVMRIEREQFLKLRHTIVIVQQRYRALIAMRKQRNMYLKTRSAAIAMQKRFKARNLMLAERAQYQKVLSAAICIQRAYRAYVTAKKQRLEYIKIKCSVILIQKWRKNINYTRKIQSQYRRLKNSAILIQRLFRLKLVARHRRRNEAANRIKSWYLSIKKRNACRSKFLEQKRIVVLIQSIFRMYVARKRFIKIKSNAITIQRYYRSFKKSKIERQRYIQVRVGITKLQAHVRRFIERNRFLKIRSAVLTIQFAYRLKKQRDLQKKREEAAAVCIQKHMRSYLVRSQYHKYRKAVTIIQELWRGKMMTRLLRCEYLQKRRIVVELQAAIRGYLVRKHVQIKKESMKKQRAERRLHWAASKIQALFRGNKARVATAKDKRVAEIRRRWREGAFESTQETIAQRYVAIMKALKCLKYVDIMIRVFMSLDLITRIFPKMFEGNPRYIARQVSSYMLVTNRSINSVELLKVASAVLTNLARYKSTGPSIYERERITPILKYMSRFCTTEPRLFCIMSTYIWVFSKYDAIKEDMTEFLKLPDNHVILLSIKQNIERKIRMDEKTRSIMPQTPRCCNKRQNSFMSNTSSMTSYNRSNSLILPDLEPDFGVERCGQPRYFEDAFQAITCLFNTYSL